MLGPLIVRVLQLIAHLSKWRPRLDMEACDPKAVRNLEAKLLFPATFAR